MPLHTRNHVKARLAAASASMILLWASTSGVGNAAATGHHSPPSYEGFVVEGGPILQGGPSDARSQFRSAALASASTGKPAVYNPDTAEYEIGPSPLARAASGIGPLDVAAGFFLPEGRLDARNPYYRWNQTTATALGVVAHPSGEIVAQVDVKFIERITGNTSSYWSYQYLLAYRKGGLYRLNVRITCAVNKTGRADDYCGSITYPDGSKETPPLSPSHVVEVHDLATGNTVNAWPTGFFGRHSTPPPDGSTQVVKYVHLTESAYFRQFDITDTALIRGYDVCVPKRVKFSGVILCSSSGTGH